MKQAKNKLSEHNTHVKIADKCGWDTLEEYLGDDLVDGPYDIAQERRIRRYQTQKR